MTNTEYFFFFVNEQTLYKQTQMILSMHLWNKKQMVEKKKIRHGN